MYFAWNLKSQRAKPLIPIKHTTEQALVEAFASTTEAYDRVVNHFSLHLHAARQQSKFGLLIRSMLTGQLHFIKHVTQLGGLSQCLINPSMLM